MDARTLVAERAERYVGWLVEACSFKSLFDDPDSLEATAQWLEARLEELGATVERLVPEEGPDALLAQLGSGERTVLIYDHYDVQPVDPIELWNTPPFEPTRRDGKVWARGVADNKGDLVARIAGLQVYQDLYGPLPVKVKFLIEGEEETGSRSFESIIERYADKLKADGCIWEGDGVDFSGRGEIVFGAKGLAYVELRHTGLSEDQHSAEAVIAPSPVWHLIEAISSFRDPSGRVLIDGFYDDVIEPDEADMDMVRAIPFEEEAERERYGVDEFVGGATGTELTRRYFFEPTCNIAGIIAGFTVPGASKTVLPKEAMAKIDMRLVPNQDPDDIVAKIRKHLDSRGFSDIEMTSFSREKPVRSSADSLIGRAVVQAAEEVFDAGVSVRPMMIGTGPMHHIAGTLGIPTVSPAGVCRPDGRIHAPNENTREDDFLRIVEYTVAWLKRFAELDA